MRTRFSAGLAIATLALTGCAYNQSTGTADVEKSRSIDAEIARMDKANKSDNARFAEDAKAIDASKHSGFWTKRIREPVSITGVHNGKTVTNECTRTAEKYRRWIPGGVSVKCVDSLSEQPGGTSYDHKLLKDASGQALENNIEVLNDQSGHSQTTEDVFVHELGHVWDSNYLSLAQTNALGTSLKDPTYNKDGSYFYWGAYALRPKEQWARGFADCVLHSKAQVTDASGRPLSRDGLDYRELSCDVIRKALEPAASDSKLPLLDIFNGVEPTKALNNRTDFNPEDRKTW